MIASQPIADPLAVPRMTVKEYRSLAERGLIADATPLELLGGVLVLKDRRDSEGDIMTVGRRHAATVRRLEKLIARVVASKQCFVQSQLPVLVDEETDPEPDVAVIKGTIEDFDAREPSASDAILLIEVADSSLMTDRGIKRARYLAAGVPCYWIVNLRNDTVEVFSSENPEEASVYDSGVLDEIPVPGLDCEIDLKAIFPAS